MISPINYKPFRIPDEEESAILEGRAVEQNDAMDGYLAPVIFFVDKFAGIPRDAGKVIASYAVIHKYEIEFQPLKVAKVMLAWSMLIDCTPRTEFARVHNNEVAITVLPPIQDRTRVRVDITCCGETFGETYVSNPVDKEKFLTEAEFEAPPNCCCCTIM